MANPQENRRSPLFPHRSRFPRPSLRRRHLKLLPRRCVAWALEVIIPLALAGLPWQLAQSARLDQGGEPLGGFLGAIAQGLIWWWGWDLTPAQLFPPAVAWLGWMGLLLSLGYVGHQWFQLRGSGQTLPKQWLRLKVVSRTGRSLTWGDLWQREFLGKWLIPGVIAYGVWHLSGTFPEFWVFWALLIMLWIGEGLWCYYDGRTCTFADVWAGVQVIDQRWRRKTDSPAAIAKPSRSFLQLLWIRERRWFMAQLRNPTIQKYIGAIAMALIMVAVLFNLAQSQVRQQREYQLRVLGENYQQTPPEDLDQRKTLLARMLSIDDPRVSAFLAPLLLQENTDDLILSIQQGLIDQGEDALNPLGEVNRQLQTTLTEMAEQPDRPLFATMAERLWLSQEAIAKILTDRPQATVPINFQGVNLAQSSDPQTTFQLVLVEKNLAGLNFRNAQLQRSNWQGSDFSYPGGDRQWGNGDDLISDFSGANLQGSNFEQADLQRCRLERANLQGVNLGYSNLYAAYLQGSNLSNGNLTGALLSFSDLREAKLNQTQLLGTKFEQSQLSGSQLQAVEAIGVNFRGSQLHRAIATDSDFSEGNFRQGDLSEGDFSRSNFDRADFTGANLAGANFQGANLSQGDLRGSNLRGANFQSAQLAIIPDATADDFITAAPVQTSMAQLEGVDFSQVKNLSPSQLEIICNQGGIHPVCPSNSD